MKYGTLFASALGLSFIPSAGQAAVLFTQPVLITGQPAFVGYAPIGTAVLNVSEFFTGDNPVDRLDIELFGVHSITTTLTGTGGYGAVYYPFAGYLLIEPGGASGYKITSGPSIFKLDDPFGPVADGQTVSGTLAHVISYSFSVELYDGHDIGDIYDELEINFYASGVDYEFTVDGATDVANFSGTFIVNADVPEPAVFALFTLGVLGVGVVASRKASRSANSQTLA
ncbi:PEP-CTERM sorting domain-containing protein [Pacificimonas sp. ICDLI1SI03]